MDFVNCCLLKEFYGIEENFIEEKKRVMQRFKKKNDNIYFHKFEKWTISQSILKILNNNLIFFFLI